MTPRKKNIPDAEAMEAFGRELAREFPSGSVVHLRGPLGAGKTTLTRGIIAGRGGSPDQVSSPTFGLIHEYETPSGPVLHCDFYRLESLEEFDALGGLELFFGPDLIIVEWLDKVPSVEKAIKNRMVTIDISVVPEGRIAEHQKNPLQKK